MSSAHESHDHDHDHSHDHEEEHFFLNQLCLIGFCGAFAVVCLTLFFFRINMLNLILGSQFHPYVLASGIVLFVLVIIRASAVWQLSGTQTHSHEHHSHDHDHDHDHERCNHDHDHDHEHVKAHTDSHVKTHSDSHTHAPATAHSHSHNHSHGHGHDHDHDHSFTPWRYVVLFIPIVLYLLGLPNTGPRVSEIERSYVSKEQVNRYLFSAFANQNPLGQVATLHTVSQWENMIYLREESEKYSKVISLSQNPITASTIFMALDAGNEADAENLPFSQLEVIKESAGAREKYDGKYVEIWGQYMPDKRSDKVFYLVRFRIKCCAADTIQLDVPMICKESLFGLNIKPRDWVKVTGRVQFHERSPGDYVTVLLLNSKKSIRAADPDPEPYIK